jgi:hypothetical protein
MVADGVVTISGFVPSFFLKQLAQEAVLCLPQVRQVRNLVVVRTAAHPLAQDSDLELELLW